MSRRFAIGESSYKKYKTLKLLGAKRMCLPLATDTGEDMHILDFNKEEILQIDFNPTAKGIIITFK